MADGIGSFGETAKGLARNPLGIIALFIVLVYGFASLVTAFGGNLSLEERMPLIYFLVAFPPVVLGVFAWLVSCHPGKLYGPGDYRDDESFLRQVSAVTYIGLAEQASAGGTGHTNFTQIAGTVKAALSDAQRPAKPSLSHVLWVDDRPENNVYVRKALEALGLSVSLALSTDEALHMLLERRFGAIISDMGRREGPREGYRLLEALRKRGDQTPFFIYAGSDAPEHRREAAERGAQGSTNRPQELIALVTAAIAR